jgi:hypothetical protein
MAQSMAHCDKDGYTEIDEVDNERDDIDNTGVANHCSIVPKREHEVRVKMTTEIRGYAPSFTLRHFTWHLGIFAIYTFKVDLEHLLDLSSDLFAQVTHLRHA